jgi:DNA-directed RNA polymerase subunit beta'
LYYITREMVNVTGEGMCFTDVNEVRRAYESNAVDIHAKVKVRFPVVVVEGHESEGQAGKTCLVETTVGRALLSEILPKGMPFHLVNRVMNKKAISSLLNNCYRRVGLKETVIFADQLMYTGFYYATRSGISIGIDDLVVPDEKQEIIEQAGLEVK